MSPNHGEVKNEQWFYCLDHRTVEPFDGCRAAVRIGPFATREEAAKALETVASSQPRMGQRPGVVRGLIRMPDVPGIGNTGRPS